MAKQPAEFWQKMMTDAGLDEAAQKAMLAGLQNEKFENALYGAFVPRAESDRHLSEAQKAKADADAARQQALQKYNENLAWFEQNKARLTQADRADEYSRLVNAYEALYGKLDGSQPTTQPQSDNGKKFLTPEEAQALVNGSQRNYWALQRQLRRAEEAYRKTFGEPMPDAAIDELEALAQKPENANRNLTDMFNEWVAPKVDAKRTADVEERIKKAREEGEAAGFAKGRTRDPMMDNPDNVSPLYRRPLPPDQKPDEAATMRNFIETYDKHMATP